MGCTLSTRSLVSHAGIVTDSKVNSSMGGFLPSPILSVSPTEISTSNGSLPAFSDAKHTIDPNNAAS